MATIGRILSSTGPDRIHITDDEAAVRKSNWRDAQVLARKKAKEAKRQAIADRASRTIQAAVRQDATSN